MMNYYHLKMTKHVNEETGDEKAESKQANEKLLLYDRVVPALDDAIRDQREFIYNSISKESVEDGKGWQRLISIEDISINKNKLRQDAIENGIKPELSD